MRLAFGSYLEPTTANGNDFDYHIFRAGGCNLEVTVKPNDAGTVIRLLAFGNGGVLGQGLGEGKQKLFYLPEAHTDFILSVVGEELGVIGVLVIAAMFLLLVHRSIRVAIYAEDNFGRFLAFGIAVLIGIEAFVNMGVVTGLLPTKGLALPFLSYGGSSLIISLFAVGLLLNVSSRMRGAP